VGRFQSCHTASIRSTKQASAPAAIIEGRGNPRRTPTTRTAAPAARATHGVPLVEDRRGRDGADEQVPQDAAGQRGGERQHQHADHVEVGVDPGQAALQREDADRRQVDNQEQLVGSRFDVAHSLTSVSVNTAVIERDYRCCMTRHRLMTTALAVAAALAAAACGGSNSTDERTSTEDPQADATDVHLSMVDNSYSPATLDVAAGETVRFIFHNDGSVRHDAVIGDAEVQAKHETEVRAAGDGAEAMDATEHGDVPALTLEPGQTGELVHTFDAGGQVIVGCHEPGHYDAGMQIAVNVT